MRVRLGAGDVRSIESAEQAADFLSAEWPGERDGFHRDALDACLKVLEGYRSTEDAEHSFRALVTRTGMDAA